MCEYRIRGSVISCTENAELELYDFYSRLPPNSCLRRHVEHGSPDFDDQIGVRGGTKVLCHVLLIDPAASETETDPLDAKPDTEIGFDDHIVEIWEKSFKSIADMQEIIASCIQTSVEYHDIGEEFFETFSVYIEDFLLRKIVATEDREQWLHTTLNRVICSQNANDMSIDEWEDYVRLIFSDPCLCEQMWKNANDVYKMIVDMLAHMDPMDVLHLWDHLQMRLGFPDVDFFYIIHRPNCLP